jgi:hypothetical protein
MTSSPAARPRGRFRLPGLVVAGCLAVAACGGHTASAHRSAAPGTAAGGSRVGDRCAAQAGGDPSRMMICLSAHHEAIPDGAGFRSCVKGVQDAAGAVECMRRLAR